MKRKAAWVTWRHYVSLLLSIFEENNPGMLSKAHWLPLLCTHLLTIFKVTCSDCIISYMALTQDTAPSQ